MATSIAPRNDAARRFTNLARILDAVCMTDELHEYSGDSERLLYTASMLARLAANKHAATNDGAENSAFDVIACIKAARLVPGDTESPERTALLADASDILGTIIEERPEHVIEPWADRPPLRRAT